MATNRIDWQLPGRRERLAGLMATGISWTRAARILSDEWKIQINSNQVRLQGRVWGISSAATKLSEEAQVIRPFLEEWHLEGDWMICADLELPYICPEMVTMLLDQAKRLRIRNLIIAGDIFEAENLSPFDAIMPTYSPATESSIAHCMVEQLRDWFREIRCLCGNHDLRILKALQGAVEPEHAIAMLASMLGGDKRVYWSVYPFLIIHTQHGNWCVEHPANARKLPLSLATERASIERVHMITAHEHKTAIAFHPDGQTIVVNIGTMCDPRKLAYAMLRRRAYPKMTQSFAALKGGRVALFSPHAAWGLGDL